MSGIRHLPVAPTQTALHPSGDTIERHRHDDHQLIYVSTGVLAIRTERGAWVASPDRAMWIPAGVWHEHRFYGTTSFHTVGFPAGDAPLAAEAPTIVAAGQLVRELLIASTDAGLPAAELRRMRAVLRDQLRRTHVQPLALPIPSDARLRDACRVVEGDLARPVTLGRVAREIGAGERTLARLFRAEFGTTYPQWRTTMRIYHAMIQLAEGATVTETAQRCGWATTSAFIDAFARTMGQTPGAYRSTLAPVSR